LSFATGWSPPSTSCTVPRIVAPQPDTASSAIRGISALAFMIFSPAVFSAIHAGARVGDGARACERDANATVANVALLICVRTRQEPPQLSPGGDKFVFAHPASFGGDAGDAREAP